ncbi:hypothetical protein ACFLYE_02460 [Chloroflexota bacterium]
MKEPGYEVVWPRGKRMAESVRFAKRLETLAGKTIGFLWDWAFRGEQIFPVIEKELSQRYPGVRFVGYEEFGSTHGGKEAEVLDALPDNLRQNKCDAVISGIGC